jgi:hypothetical protein
VNVSFAYTTLFNDSCDYANGQDIDWPKKWLAGGYAPTHEYNNNQMRIVPGDWNWAEFVCNPRCRANDFTLFNPNNATGIWYSLDISDIQVNTVNPGGAEAQIILGLFNHQLITGPYNNDQTGVYLLATYNSEDGNFGIEVWKKPPTASMGTQIAVGGTTFSAGAKLEFYVNDTIVSARYNNVDILCTNHGIDFVTLEMDKGVIPYLRFSNNDTARCQGGFDNIRIEHRDVALITAEQTDTFPGNPDTAKWTVSDDSVTNNGAGCIVLSPGTGQPYLKDFIVPMSEYYQAGRFAVVPGREMDVVIEDATVYSSSANPDGYTQIQATPELVLDNMWNFNGTVLAARIAYNDLTTVDFELLKIIGGSSTILASSNTPYVAGAKLSLIFDQTYAKATYGTGTITLTETHGLNIPTAFSDGVYFNVVQANDNGTASVGIDVDEITIKQGVIPEPFLFVIYQVLFIVCYRKIGMRAAF